MDAVDSASIAGGSQKSLGARTQGIHHIITGSPELARSSLGAQFIHFRTVGNESIAARGLY